MRRALWITGGILATLALTVVILLAIDPDPEPAGPIGRELASPGPWSVRKLDLTLVDRSRSTPASREVASSPERTLATTVWLPESDGAGALPLVVYAHGFMGNRSENARLCDHLAGRGFVVAAVDFPRTSSESAGDPDFADLAQQPGDIRFVIDSLLEQSLDTANPLHGRLDGRRIGLVGLSLGGMTAQLVAFHPRLRDPRIDAVALLRWTNNPDSLACDNLEGHTPKGLPPIGEPSDGIILKPDTSLPCQHSPLSRSMRPPRQRMLTRIAVTAFLEARLRDGVDDLPKLRAVASENADVSLEVAP